MASSNDATAAGSSGRSKEKKLPRQVDPGIESQVIKELPPRQQRPHYVEEESDTAAPSATQLQKELLPEEASSSSAAAAKGDEGGGGGNDNMRLPAAAVGRSSSIILAAVGIPTTTVGRHVSSYSSSNPGAFAVDGPGLLQEPGTRRQQQPEWTNMMMEVAAMESTNSSADNTAALLEGGIPHHDQQEENLAEANPLSEEEESGLGLMTVAKEVDTQELGQRAERNKQDRRRWRIGCAIVSAVLLALAVVIPVIVLLTRDAAKPMIASPAVLNKETTTATQTSATTLEDKVLVLLPQSTVDAIMDSNTSAQAMAYDWLIHHDNASLLLNYSSQRIVQRFALVSM